MNEKLVFDENIGDDSVTCWGVSVPILKSSLFGRTREEREEAIKRKILEIVSRDEMSFLLNAKFVRISLASAWVRYYVFRVEAHFDNSIERFALNVIAPGSPLKSFKSVVSEIERIINTFPDNLAKPIIVGEDFMLQEWVDGKPLSEFRDGDIMRDVEEARKCISPVARFLYRLKKMGFVYHPWDDYEVVVRNGEPVFLDVTRFERRELDAEDFLDFYYGAPFTPPEVIKPSDNPAHRLYWRGVRDEDYFGAERDEYLRLFLEGVAEACESRDEFEKVVSGIEKIGIPLNMKNTENLCSVRR